MTNAQCVLTDLLRKSLFNFDINIPEDTDWQAVYDEANFQAVIPLAFDGTAGIDGIPEDIYKKFKNHTVAVMLNNDSVTKGQQELTDLLEKNNVKYSILKGLSVARYYPKPELRTLGDVDFLVSKQDFESTKQLLVDNGYAFDEEEDVQEIYSSTMKNKTSLSEEEFYNVIKSQCDVDEMYDLRYKEFN